MGVVNRDSASADGIFRVKLMVPPGAAIQLNLPVCDPTLVTETVEGATLTAMLEQSTEVKLTASAKTVILVSSGSYVFEMPLLEATATQPRTSARCTNPADRTSLPIRHTDNAQ